MQSVRFYKRIELEQKRASLSSFFFINKPMKQIILKIPAFSKIPEPAPLSPLVYDLYTSGIQREHMQKVNIGLKKK